MEERYHALIARSAAALGISDVAEGSLASNQAGGSFVRCPLCSKSGQLRWRLAKSALCQKRTYAPAPQQKRRLFDHLVGEQLQCVWHFEAERLNAVIWRKMS